MTATTGKAGRSAKLKMGDGGGPEIFTAVANIASVTGPNETMTMLDGTHLDSGEFTEKIPGMKDGGQVAMNCHFDPTNATHDASTGLKKKFDDKTLTNFQIDLTAIWATNNLISFAAYVNLGPIQIAPNEIITREVTLEVSGAVTWSTAA
ncbi:hypothetical protein D3227_25715 [Mesorhizobium waimense]|uniref:Lambda phage tail tube protein N-terminal domain-containing protein n=1 Tax=Mesorhizobium waimense TaxID=1300307 RepID=A0A3A5KJA0_9HYPH|nr:phage tail tube protein [Mesorhizobium waimense]RJT32800.1 hypothetical protein D3227_25715 [Mesorhizobium waimense]